MPLCVELCSGYGTLSEAFVKAGWTVIRFDNDPGFVSIPYTVIADVNDRQSLTETIHRIDKGAGIDFLIATPPCNTFSVASIGHHWTGGKGAYITKTTQAKDAINLVMNLFDLDSYFEPRYFLLENPRDVLRKLFSAWLAGTVWLCQYGDSRAKPTDLFGRLPEAFTFRTCRNGAKDHEEARRGAKTGTQGIEGAKARAKMPFGLSLALLQAYEKSWGKSGSSQTEDFSRRSVTSNW